uniref:Glutamate ionotropic [NMDA] receptor 2B n=1 Tax=Polyphagotarsonemus latus TaxID=1204166 RepID=A0AAN0LJ18_9ACAR
MFPFIKTILVLNFIQFIFSLNQFSTNVNSSYTDKELNSSIKNFSNDSIYRLSQKTPSKKINSLNEKSLNDFSLKNDKKLIEKIFQKNQATTNDKPLNYKNFNSKKRFKKKLNKLDEEVFRLYKQQSSINYLKSPKIYEILLRSTRSSSNGIEKITLGAILPKSSFKTVLRSYQKRLQNAVEDLMSSKNNVFHFLQRFHITQARLVLLSLNPTPSEILEALCNQLLPHNVSTIIYMSNSDTYENNPASALYLMQLTSYLGIPVIAWNPDNIGLEQRVSNSLMLQLAPSVSHQAHAMLSLLRRYSWHSFSVLSTNSTGHEHFVRSLRDQMLTVHDYKYTILDVFVFKTRSKEDIRNELRELAKSESRVYLLYCPKSHAQTILEEAAALGLTKRNYVWIVSESIVGTDLSAHAPAQFPPGMLGIYFNTTNLRLFDEIERAVNIFGHGLENFVGNGLNAHLSLSPDLRCNETTDYRWIVGEILFRHIRSVSIRTKTGKPNLEFNLDGTLKYVELDIMNLNSAGIWDKIGVWNKNGLEIKDITWPENSPVPPPGVPEKFSLKVTFLEEPPFLNSMNPNNETGECKTSRSVRCRYAPLSEIKNINKEDAYKNPNLYRCCSGFCIDLLQKFSQDLKFSFELYRVEDGNWGILNNGSWNGLIQELLDHKADMVVTSIKINSERQAYVDFTVPFLETGITIVVGKRTGIISPKAFLEPFDTTSWVMILLVFIQVAAFAIFIFEWLSPSGYNMSMRPTKVHKFSLCRTYWLVWAILFGAAVPINCPRGYTAKFMSNVWATFAVVFLAIYTANLAAFMITREDFYDFNGIEDTRLANPTHTDPPLRFGTIPHGNTEAVLKRNKPRMHSYMKKYNTSSSLEGVKMVRNGNLDAFIYDAVVLDYMAGQDPDCRLLTVGSWYSMTGYGFAFAKNSKYLTKFNEKMIEYRENGDLERLRKFWFQGACKPTKDKGNLEGKLSNPLDVNQFVSAFLLLGFGILLTFVLLLGENFYFRYCIKHFLSDEKDPCLSLISLSMAKSLKKSVSVSATNLQEIDKPMISNNQDKIKISDDNILNEKDKKKSNSVLVLKTNNNESANHIINTNTKGYLNKSNKQVNKKQTKPLCEKLNQKNFNNLKLNNLETFSHKNPNFYKLDHLQQRFLSSCACNNCELCNKQTRAIQLLQQELEMARCELRSLRHYLFLSNSSKQPLNITNYSTDPIQPQRYSTSVPTTPRHKSCTNQCQECYLNYPQTNLTPNNFTADINQINCGLEHLLPSVNCTFNQSDLYLDDYVNKSYNEHCAKKAQNLYKKKSYKYDPLGKKVQTCNINKLENSELDKKNFTDIETYNQDEFNYIDINPSKKVQPNNLNKMVCSNVKTQSSSQFNRLKITKSLTRSLSRDNEFGSFNYSKSESFDDLKYLQNNRAQNEEINN